MIASLGMLRNLFIVVFFTYFCESALAVPNRSYRSSSRIKEVYFNIGTHTQFYNAIQNDDSGGLRKTDWKPVIGAGIGIPMTTNFIFLPEFNWVLPQTHEGSKILSNLFMFRGDISHVPFGWLRLRLGTSLMWANQQGRGGSAQMNNGNGRSTFYYPDENKSSLNNTLDFGIEAVFEKFAFRLQTYTYSFFVKEQKQLSYSLFLTYYWKK